MRWMTWFVITGVAGFLCFAKAVNDGGVMLPVTISDDGSVTWPVTDQAIEDCTFWCLMGGCGTGMILDCTCSGGRVCCLVYQCVMTEWWRFWQPCGCAIVIECYRIPCTPNQPIPMQDVELPANNPCGL